MGFKPNAGEIGNLWKYIVANQAHLCFLEYWISHAEDEDLRVILQQSKKDATQIVEEGLQLYTRAGFPPPIGFSLEKDVVPDTPRLMSDKLIFFVLQVLSEYGVYGYGLSLGKTETPEVLDFFKRKLTNAAELYQNITEQVIKKGFQKQEVFIPAPKQAEMVEKRSFLAGWFGEQRPLTSIEIDNQCLSS